MGNDKGAPGVATLGQGFPFVIGCGNRRGQCYNIIGWNDPTTARMC